MFSLSELLTSDVTQRYFVFSVIVFSFQIVTMVLLKHMLHLVKKLYFSESY